MCYTTSFSNTNKVVFYNKLYISATKWAHIWRNQQYSWWVINQNLPLQKKHNFFRKIIKCPKTLLLLTLQPFFVVTMNTYSSAIILGVILKYKIYPYPKYLQFSEFYSKYLTSVCVIHSLLEHTFVYLLHGLLHHYEYISIKYITDRNISPPESIFKKLNIIYTFLEFYHLLQEFM